jgi:hypothetical protein
MQPLPECSSWKSRIVTNALQSYSTWSPYVQPPYDNTSQSKYVLEHFLRPQERSAHLTIKRNRKTSGNINVKAREACDETQPSKIVSAAAERTPLCGAGARLAIATG